MMLILDLWKMGAQSLRSSAYTDTLIDLKCNSTLQEKRENIEMMWFGPPESGPAILTDADCFVLDTCVAVAIHCYYSKSNK